MKSRFLRRATALVVLGTIATIANTNEASGTTDDPKVATLAWLSGCWEQKSGSRIVEERWTKPLGGLMLGVSRSSRNDSIVEFEQVRIETRPQGIFYVASPSRQATAEFKATSVLDSAVTFENPEHDFPRKIMYRKQGRDSIIASIEGPRGGQTRTIAFPYRRVSCD